MRDIRVATVQFQHVAGDKAYNFGRICHFATEAARARVEMIAFPEMCLTGYWHVRNLSGAAFEALAQPVPDGPSTRDLLDLSRAHGMTIGAGLLERAPDCGVYNEYVVAMADRACEAELYGPKGRAWLMRWLPSRAHDNGMFLLFSNGIGPDDDEIRTGNAMVLDPYGDVIAESRALGDDMVVADLDASVLPTSSGRRWLRARRPELYASLTRPTGQEQETRRVRFGE